MASIIPLLIVIVTLVNSYFVREYPQLPSQVMYFPDVVIAIASAFVVAQLVATRAWAMIPLRYVLVLSAFLYVCVTGIIVNGVSSETVFAGVRTYLKYLPVFLIPFAFRFSDNALKVQLTIITIILLLQVPLTIWQKFFLYYTLETGDVITGTFGTTTSLCIIGTCAILCCGALFIDRVIGLLATLFLSFLFLFPAAISETKITPILLIGGGIGLLVVRWDRLGAKRAMQLAAFGGLLIGIFVMFYDALYESAAGEGYLDKLSPRNSLDSYNMTGVGAREFKIARQSAYRVVGVKPELKDDPDKEAGRIDSLRLPFEALLQHQPVRLLVGLGIGNAHSQFGSGGDYLNVKTDLDGMSTSISMLLWETGILGTLAFCCLIFLLAKDALFASRISGFTGTLGTGVLAVVAVWILSMVYANLFFLPEVLVLWFYFTGTVVSRIQAIKRASIGSPVSA